jgi:DNA ligase-1
MPSNEFRPMLAKEYDPAKQVYPCYASPKIDGIRGAVKGGRLLSRSLKEIPNKHVQNALADPLFNGFDGELVVGPITAPDVFNQTTSHVMSHDKVFDFTYVVFDKHDSEMGFDVRFAELKRQHAAVAGPRLRARMVGGVRIVLLEQVLIRDAMHLDEYESEQIELGYEGVILRSIDGLYKFGRSTVNEGNLLKVKRFTDSEAFVVGFEEQMKNNNEATTNELGRTKRSSHAENKAGKGTLGALILRDPDTGVTFNCGTGMDDKTRQHIWDNQDKFMGQLWKYKSFKVGEKDKPRHPVSLGPRSALDMS